MAGQLLWLAIIYISKLLLSHGLSASSAAGREHMVNVCASCRSYQMKASPTCIITLLSPRLGT